MQLHAKKNKIIKIQESTTTLKEEQQESFENNDRTCFEQDILTRLPVCATRPITLIL